jgi:hypothetical protein
MPQVGLEPTIPAFERVKTVHALDRAATVIGTADMEIMQLQFMLSEMQYNFGKVKLYIS